MTLITLITGELSFHHDYYVETDLRWNDELCLRFTQVRKAVETEKDGRTVKVAKPLEKGDEQCICTIPIRSILMYKTVTKRVDDIMM